MAEQQTSPEPPIDLNRLLRSESSEKASMGRGLAISFPQLIDKLSEPSMLKDSAFHSVVPRLSLGNFSREDVDLISTITPDIVFEYVSWVEQGWIDNSLAFEAAASWMVNVEATRGENGKWSQLVMGEIQNITLQKKESKKTNSAFDKGE